MLTQEAVQFSGNANNPASFTLSLGGSHLLSVKATGYGSVELQVLGPDGTTWLPIQNMQYNGSIDTFVTVASFTADGARVQFLPPGTYRWNITTATSVSASVVRIPI